MYVPEIELNYCLSADLQFELETVFTGLPEDIRHWLKRSALIDTVLKAAPVFLSPVRTRKDYSACC
ncbi:hypothetical protein EYZ11_012471 [Aspergillus tanneri]|uniref:Uncharacterized protein n=1 Tax=Aspergillus tanneri TaxID=1220188 RepID=A0A4S3J060_9EURO|nr:hypothetical protein EYZ11_012471 [Aspergillus tanneri]